MRKILYWSLAVMAKAIIKKYKPKIIGITGSVGKTSTKEAVFCVVSQKYETRKSDKNFNNEIGLPLTIIGADSPGKSVLGWLFVHLKAASLILFRGSYPEFLVLEYGIDRVGDMRDLLSIAKPDLGIITSIGLSHYEFFQDEEVIEQEKGGLAESLNSSNFLIVNADNKRSERQKLKTNAHSLSYGILNGNADIKMLNAEVAYFPETKTSVECLVKGLKFDFEIMATGSPHLYSALAAIGTAQVLGIGFEYVKDGLRNYKPAPGRLNVIPGIKKTILIDDTYNASPDSTKEALSLLKSFPNPYKLAVLGDMLELGSKSEESHFSIGKLVTELRIDGLVTVGASGKIIAEGARTNGMESNKIISFDTAEEARLFVQESLIPESAVLLKGSQGVRIEKITKEIMAEPLLASKILCRQYGNWLNS